MLENIASGRADDPTPTRDQVFRETRKEKKKPIDETTRELLVSSEGFSELLKFCF